MTTPSFVHDFDRWWTHNWEYEEAHSTSGAAHLEIDFLLMKFQRKLGRHKKKPWYRLFRACISFLWGLNCGFPTKNIIRFTLWEYRGSPNSTLSKTNENSVYPDKTEVEK